MAKNTYTIGTVQTQPGGRGPRMGRPMEKAKDAKKAWRETIRYCKPYLVWFAIAFTAALISVLLTLFAPNQLSRSRLESRTVRQQHIMSAYHVVYFLV